MYSTAVVDLQHCRLAIFVTYGHFMQRPDLVDRLFLVLMNSVQYCSVCQSGVQGLPGVIEEVSGGPPQLNRIDRNQTDPCVP